MKTEIEKTENCNKEHLFAVWGNAGNLDSWNCTLPKGHKGVHMKYEFTPCETCGHRESRHQLSKTCLIRRKYVFCGCKKFRSEYLSAENIDGGSRTSQHGVSGLSTVEETLSSSETKSEAKK